METTYDLRPLNDYDAYQREHFIIGAFVVGSTVLAGFGAWALTRPASDYSFGYGPLYFEVFVTSLATCFLAIMELTAGRTPAVQLSLGSKGVVFTYASGRTREHVWANSNFKLVFLDRTLSNAFNERTGERGISLSMVGVGRSFIPPSAFDQLSELATQAGVPSSRSRHPATGGVRVTFSRNS